MVRILLAVVLAVGVVATVPVRAAGSCAGLTEADQLRLADVVFTGAIAADDTARGQRRITFDVDRVYKGQVASRQVVLTSPDRNAYGLDDVVGAGTFVIFGRYGGGSVVAELCGGSRPGTAPASYGEGRAPNPGVAGDTGPRWPLGLSIAVTTALVAGAAWLVVRRRR